MNLADIAYTPKGAHRAISIFRGRYMDSAVDKTVELLYGEEFLDAYSVSNGWRSVPNNMNAAARKPKYGHSGFGNRSNNYTWTMQVFNGKLYVGTMDELGANLYCFPDGESGAMPVNVFGLGNIANHGIGTMFADDEYLYMGTANRYNISSFMAEELISINPDFKFFEDTNHFSSLGVFV